MTFIKPQFLGFYKPRKPQSSPRTPVGAALTTTELQRRRRGSSRDSSQACSPLPAPARPHPAGSPLGTQTPGRAGPALPGRKRGSPHWEPPIIEPRRPGPDEGTGDEENPPGLAVPRYLSALGMTTPPSREWFLFTAILAPVAAVTSHPARPRPGNASRWPRPPSGAREAEVRGKRGGSEAVLGWFNGRRWRWGPARGGPARPHNEPQTLVPTRSPARSSGPLCSV